MAFVGPNRADILTLRFSMPRLADVSDWLGARRANRQLRQAAERLDALSPHLLADVGLEFVPDGES